METNRVKHIRDFGQSIWLDFLDREIMDSGKLKKLIEEDGVRGLTSNPAIFEKAISNSSAYDEDIASLSKQKNSSEEIFFGLAIKDIKRATDFFKPVYDETKGGDGFVSLEVSPHLARDTEGTIKQARELWKAVDRQNVMIKIPGTEEGLPAIRKCISEGININITLLFGLPRYREVTVAYMQGLETLKGEVAIASAKKAYEIYKEVIKTEQFRNLEAKGAKRQRVLWASTSTKDPSYSDVKYVEALIGKETINTIPMETLEAFRDHGQAANNLEDDMAKAKQGLKQLKENGINIDTITQKLC